MNRIVLRRILGDERGLSLVEMMVAGIAMMLISSMLLTWAVIAMNADRAHQERLETMDELRLAKADIAKQVRNADGILASSTSTKLLIWHDADGNDFPQSAEVTVWEIVGTELVTYPLADPDSAHIISGHLTSGSAFVVIYEAATAVGVNAAFEADIDGTGSSPPFSIVLEATIRNA